MEESTGVTTEEAAAVTTGEPAVIDFVYEEEAAPVAVAVVPSAAEIVEAWFREWFTGRALPTEFYNFAYRARDELLPLVNGAAVEDREEIVRVWFRDVFYRVRFEEEFFGLAVQATDALCGSFQ